MRKLLVTVFIVLLSVVGFLLFPFLSKDRSGRLSNFQGPKLRELTFRETFFENKTDNIKLAGLLFVPKGEGPFPVAVMIHGSGSSTRENPWYLAIVKTLQDSGIAVLLPDKRGCEKSEGDWVGKGVEELATDTEAAISFIKTQKIFGYSSVGVVGLSQGGWIAPVVASGSNELAFVVNVSGSATTGYEQLLFEERNNIALFTYDFIAGLIAPITTEKLVKMKSVAPFVEFDPLPYWKKVSIPVFIGYGENDTNCPVNLSLERLRQTELKNLKLKIYPDGGHAVLNKSKTGLNEAFMKDLATFVLRPEANAR